MEFNYAYRGHSHVESRADRSTVSFAPDLTRTPTYFQGELRQSLAFREAISALHDVVVQDLRWKPKDKAAYKAWASQREEFDWMEVATQRQEVATQLHAVRQELSELQNRSQARLRPFYEARQRYYNYLYEKERDVWFVLDPIVTVHPDELFFECFSQDESTYARLGASYNIFGKLDKQACGTTNVDYSAALYREFQKIRTYKTTQFCVDPSGINVQTGGDDYREVKIDLPDSWVRGLLQVSSAMSLPATQLVLHPMDVLNICFVLRRHKEIKGPRAMRYELTPGKPVRVVFEPWEIVVDCPRSPYAGSRAQTIRVWGRRRLLALERLLPLARRFTVHLLGTGMPSFYVADLGDMSFTLGLSGWTANDWSRQGNFDLLAPRAQVDASTARRVFDALKENWLETPDVLARRLHLDSSLVLGALSIWSQAGRAMFDLNRGVYRARELTRDPLPLDSLRYASPLEQAATDLYFQRAVRLGSVHQRVDGPLEVRGTVLERGRTRVLSIVLDGDERMVDAHCDCDHFVQHKLFKGPCTHMLALRLAHNRARLQA